MALKLKQKKQKNKKNKNFSDFYENSHIGVYLNANEGFRSKFYFGPKKGPHTLVFGTFRHFFGFFLVLSFFVYKMMLLS